MPKRRTSESDGFTLIEIAVAGALFLIVSGAAITMLITSLETIRGNATRVYAAALAREEVESIRSSRDFTTGEITSDPIATDRGEFVMTTSTQWTGSNSNIDPCNPNATWSQTDPLLLRVDVAVTGRGLSEPQTATTLLRPSAEIVDRVANDQVGSIVVSVVDSRNQPLSGIAISVQEKAPGSFKLPIAYTDASGCAFVPGIPVGGQWEVVASHPSKIAGPAGASSELTGLTAGDIKTFQPLAFDDPIRLTLSLPNDPDFTLARALALKDGSAPSSGFFPVTLVDPNGLDISTSITELQSGSWTSETLWPFGDGARYQARLGACAASGQLFTPMSGEPGREWSGTLRGKRVLFVTADGSSLTFTHRDGASGSGTCLEVYGLEAPAGPLPTGTLPYGPWQMTGAEPVRFDLVDDGTDTICSVVLDPYDPEVWQVDEVVGYPDASSLADLTPRDDDGVLEAPLLPDEYTVLDTAGALDQSGTEATEAVYSPGLVLRWKRNDASDAEFGWRPIDDGTWQARDGNGTWAALTDFPADAPPNPVTLPAECPTWVSTP